MTTDIPIDLTFCCLEVKVVKDEISLMIANLGTILVFETYNSYVNIHIRDISIKFPHKISKFQEKLSSGSVVCQKASITGLQKKIKKELKFF